MPRVAASADPRRSATRRNACFVTGCHYRSSMYLVVMGMLALILTLSGPVCRLLTDPGQIIAAVAAATLLPGAVGLLVTRRVLHTLDRWPDVPSRGQAAFGRGMVALQALLAVCHGGVFAFTDWLPLCNRTPVVGAWPLVPALLALVPFLLSIVLIWLAVYGPIGPCGRSRWRCTFFAASRCGRCGRSSNTCSTTCDTRCCSSWSPCC